MNKVLVIDFGSQYCKLIARRIRKLGVFSQIFPSNKKGIINIAKNFDAIIMSGGPNSVYDKNSLTIDKEIFELNIPILATCYGMQLVHYKLGGKVEKLDSGEFGKTSLKLIGNFDITNNVDQNSIVWMSHFDSITQLAPGFEIIAETNKCIALTANIEKKIYTTQFHPEVENTMFGTQIISNFLFDIAKLSANWKMKSIVKNKINNAKKIIKNKKIILGLSGGIDSSVVALLLHKAVGNQLIPVFINNGLLRKNEVENVEKMFKQHFKMNLIVIDASEEFYSALKGLTDPEMKRKAIGAVFIDQFTKIKNRFKDVHFLAQGTIYPDVIESSGEHGVANVIKSHHNVGGLPDKLKFKIFEPLRNLFKDEVRELGLELGLPKKMVMRHPFPGPGLAIRIIGEITKERVKTLQEVDHIFISSLIKNNLYDKVSQAAAILTPIKTVGVQGDKRTYENLVALRAVDTSDFMTASFSKLSLEFLGDVSTNIINKVDNVNRVVYDITSKPPGTIEWE